MTRAGERLSSLAWWGPRALLAAFLVYHFGWVHRPRPDAASSPA